MCLISNMIHFTEENKDVKVFISLCSYSWVGHRAFFDLFFGGGRTLSRCLERGRRVESALLLSLFLIGLKLQQI